jgi:hypothetical protein
LIIKSVCGKNKNKFWKSGLKKIPERHFILFFFLSKKETKEKQSEKEEVEKERECSRYCASWMISLWLRDRMYIISARSSATKTLTAWESGSGW